MRTWRWYSKLLFALLVTAFAYFVWPTPWRYHDFDGVPFRSHRLTDRVQVLGYRGWEDLATKAADKAVAAERQQPEEGTVGDVARKQGGRTWGELARERNMSARRWADVALMAVGVAVGLALFALGLRAWWRQWRTL